MNRLLQYFITSLSNKALSMNPLAESLNATISAELEPGTGTVAITFVDAGIPYDPLAKADPDVTLSAEERQIGGLGIFMVKKSMDGMEYEHRNGQNILTIRKLL